MASEDFVTIGSYATAHEAELGRLTLVNEGVEAFVANTSTQQIVGMGSAVPCELKVRQSDVQKARDALSSAMSTASGEAESYSPKFARKRRVGKILFVSIFVLPVLFLVFAYFLKR